MLQTNDSNTSTSEKANEIKRLSRTIKLQRLIFFANTKDKTPSLSRSSVVYKFTYPGYSAERILHERTAGHAFPNKNSSDQSTIYKDLLTCSHYSHILDLFHVSNHGVNGNKFNINQLKVTLLHFAVSLAFIDKFEHSIVL